MTALEFLRHVWPPTGLYCIATQLEVGFAHDVFSSLESAAEFATKNAAHKNMFFSTHTLKQRSVFNPNKKNPDGSYGGPSVRLQANMRSSKALFFDLDVGSKDGQYASQDEAILALRTFVKATGLPTPMLVSSGGGVHVYWVLEEEIESEAWRPYAQRLKQLANKHQLRYDPSRTTDTSSILRVVGTNNLKHDTSRPVVMLMQGSVVSIADFDARVVTALGDYVPEAVAPAAVPMLGLPPRPARTLPADFESNLTPEITGAYSGTVYTIKDVLLTCGQMRRLAAAKGNMSEPEWYHSLGVIKCTDKPEHNAVKWSEGYPNFNRQATLDKMEQNRIQTGGGMTSCAKLREVSGQANDHICQACPFWVSAGQKLFKALELNAEPSKPPPVEERVGDEIIVRESCPMPEPYRRPPKGPGVQIMEKDDKGVVTANTVYAYDFYPLQRAVNSGAKTEHHVWRVHLPHEPVKDIVIGAGTATDQRELRRLLAEQGINPPHFPEFHRYMSAYIRRLQALTAPTEQYNHIGWIKDHTEFVLPDIIIRADGSVVPTSLGKTAQNAYLFMKKRGTLQRQVELMRFFLDPRYANRQFMIVAALATPWLYATGQHGVILNATGEGGCSKSTSMFIGAGFYGDPDTYALSATKGKMTANARNTHLELLANVPFCFDEVTLLEPDEQRGLALGIDKPGKPMRLNQDGTPKLIEGDDNLRSNIMISTSNRSMHETIAFGNAAGTAATMRVFEMVFKKNGVHTVPQANVFLRELKQNYGWIGPEFLKLTVPHAKEIEARIHKKMAEIETEYKAREEERFWFALISVVLVTCELAFELGLLPYDVEVIKHWALEVQLPLLRNDVQQELADRAPAKVLTDYLGIINHQLVKILEVDGHPHDRWVPHTAWMGHHEIAKGALWVLRAGFTTYCERNNMSAKTVLSQLVADGVVTDRDIRFTLGRGTGMPQGQMRCFKINMRHPAIAEVVDVVSSWVSNVVPLRAPAAAPPAPAQSSDHGVA